MGFNVLWNRAALDEINELDKAIRERIYTRITSNLAEDPRGVGTALSGILAGLGRYRVGDYRVVYVIDLAEETIRVMSVGHRKDVYDR